MTREEAIEALKEHSCSLCDYYAQNMDSCDSRFCEAREAIELLNQQKEKEGHWEKEVFDLGENLPLRIAYQCSECGEFFDFESHYCPTCGAHMKGGD